MRGDAVDIGGSIGRDPQVVHIELHFVPTGFILKVLVFHHYLWLKVRCTLILLIIKEEPENIIAVVAVSRIVFILEK